MPGGGVATGILSGVANKVVVSVHQGVDQHLPW